MVDVQKFLRSQSVSLRGIFIHDLNKEWSEEKLILMFLTFLFYLTCFIFIIETIYGT